MTPEDMARHALLRFRPQQGYDLTALAMADGRAVFRAQPVGKGRVIIVKTAPMDARPRLARQFRRQRAVFRARLAVPRPMFLDPDLPVMAMEHIPGHSFRDLWLPDSAADLGARAGRWLAAFHGLAHEIRALDCAPMLRWLDTLGPDPDARQRLTTLAQAADGTPVPHSIIHGDFHPGNLIATSDGHTIGLDFENTKANLPQRDLFFFLTEAAVQGACPADAFLHAYGPQNTPPEALAFIDTYLATAAHARAINTGQKGSKMQARLDFLRPILRGETGLLARRTA